MNRTTSRNIQNVLNHIQIEAMMTGLIPRDMKLVYNKGNQTNGISSSVAAKDGEGHMVMPPNFLPIFNYRMGMAEQERLLEAQLNVFYAFRRKAEEDKRKEPVDIPRTV